MTVDIRPATAARFEDVVTILGPKREGAQGCWCLGYRLGHPEESELVGARARSEAMHALCRRRSHAPGVLAYADDEVVGWAAISPREELAEFTRAARYQVGTGDDDDPWVAFCFRVRAGHGRQGVARALLIGAVEYAAERGAGAVIGYPVDNHGERVDRTLASVGTRAMFERAGFAAVAELPGRRSGFAQVLMRREV
jgi:GNAT superfamily N-acetyltransferase